MTIAVKGGDILLRATHITPKWAVDMGLAINRTKSDMILFKHSRINILKGHPNSSCGLYGIIRVVARQGAKLQGNPP